MTVPRGGFTAHGGYEPPTGAPPHNATYRQGTYPEPVQSQGGRQLPPASSAPRFQDTPSRSGGPQFADGNRFPNEPRYPNEPQYPNEPRYPNEPQYPNGPNGPDAPGGYPGPNGPRGQGGYARPAGPGGYAGAPGPGGPVRPAGPRRRITDAFARLGALTPGAGLAAARRSRDHAGWDEDAGYRPDENAGPWPPDASGRPAREYDDSPQSKNRNRVLVAGAGVLCVVAIGGVILAPKVLKPADPGCKTYAGPALTAYDKTIHDLNTQASQSLLSADMSAAVSQLTQAVADAHGPAVKSALNGLLSELKTVQADVTAGEVPTSTVNALNAASTTADKAC